MGTYLGVALGEKVPAGGLFEAICDDGGERKVDLWDQGRGTNSTGGSGPLWLLCMPSRLRLGSTDSRSPCGWSRWFSHDYNTGDLGRVPFLFLYLNTQTVGVPSVSARSFQSQGGLAPFWHGHTPVLSLMGTRDQQDADTLPYLSALACPPTWHTNPQKSRLTSIREAHTLDD